MDVELVYFAGCPNIHKARQRLLSACKAAAIAPQWQEWRADDPEGPRHVRNWGSPTILVNGRDVAGATKNTGDANCRLYAGPDGILDGAPAVALIQEALRLSATQNKAGDIRTERERKKHWSTLLAFIPVVAAALLPTCPACWPLYAGLLASMGIEFAEGSPYAASLILLFLTIALVTLAYQARSRQEYGPLWLGGLGTVLVLISKFAIVSGWILHGGVALLLAAFIWNVLFRKSRPDSGGACPACLPQHTTTVP